MTTFRRSILQGIFIMEKIGLPNDNMLLVNAGRIKALILEEKALDIMDRGIDIYIHDGIRGLCIYNLFIISLFIYYFIIYLSFVYLIIKRTL